MNYEEALYFMTHNGATSSQETVSYQMMIEAMEKQIPKKLRGYHCPICSHYFEDGEDRNYCPSCGQRVEL